MLVGMRKQRSSEYLHTGEAPTRKWLLLLLEKFKLIVHQNSYRSIFCHQLIGESIYYFRSTTLGVCVGGPFHRW